MDAFNTILKHFFYINNYKLFIIYNFSYNIEIYLKYYLYFLLIVIIIFTYLYS